jgi:hypothetical protein
VIRRGRRRALLPLAIAAALASGCAGLRPAPIPVAGDARPAALLAELARADARRRSLRAVAKLSLEGPAGAGRAKQILLVERPDRLRVEVLGLLDQTVAVLTTDGVRYQLFRSEGRSRTEGPVHAGLLWEVAGLAVTPEQAVRILLGAPAPPPEARLTGGTQLADGRLRLDLREPGSSGSLRLEFDRLARLVGWSLLDAGGATLREARFADHRPLGDELFPYELELFDHTTGAHARVVFLQVELNPALEPALFELARGGAG